MKYKYIYTVKNSVKEFFHEKFTFDNTVMNKECVAKLTFSSQYTCTGKMTKLYNLI